MRKSPSSALSLLLCLLVASPGSALAAGETPSSSPLTSGLEGVASALNTTNSVISSVQYSQQQMQTLVNQFGALQAQNAAATQSLSQFDQAKQQLAASLATAQQCMMQADTNTKAKIAKYKKATMKPGDLTAAEPTCSSYGAIMDSARKNLDEMAAAKTKAACLQSLQNSMTQIAESSKQSFNQLTQAAVKVWNTRDQIINTHKGIADRIDKDLNGENGYRAQLAKLKETSAKINNAIGAGFTSKEGSGGFDARIRSIKALRVTKANEWYYSIMGQTESCFANDVNQECYAGGTASPAACIRAEVARSSGSAAEAAIAKSNTEKLNHAFQKNVGLIKSKDQLSNVDVSNPDAFLAHTNKRFNEKLNAVTQTFRRMALVGKTSPSAIGDFARQKYQGCYESAVAAFRSDISSEGPYKQSMRAVEEQEAAMNQEVKNLLDSAQQQMTDFRTSFNRVYSTELSQFSASCSSSDSSVYQSVDCLKMIAANLKAGIEGSVQTQTLDNKTTYRANPSDTVLNLQTLSLDTTGKPSLSTKSTNCKGFNECINTLSEYHRHQSEQADKQTEERKAFVEQHNETLQTSMTGLTAQFSEVSKLFTEEIRKLNAEVGTLGITASIATKQVEGEQLKANEKTGLYDMPTSMKAAFAGVGSFTEMESPQEVYSAMQTRFGELQKKVAEAAKKKSECRVKKEDYNQIAEQLVCEEEKVCAASNLTGIIDPMENVFNKTSKDPKSGEFSSAESRYQSCLSSAERRSENVEDRVSRLEESKDRIEDRNTNASTRKQRIDNNIAKLRERGEAVEGRAEKACNNQLVSSLNTQATKARGSFAGTNQGIMNAFRKMANACPDDKEAAAAACKSIKRAAAAGTGNDAEDETKVEDGSSSTTPATPFTNPLQGVGGATSAK